MNKAKIEVHGGDFVAGQFGELLEDEGEWSFFGVKPPKGPVLTLPMPGVPPKPIVDCLLGLFGFTPRPVIVQEEIPLSKLVRVEAVNKEERHRTGVAVGRGIAGALVGGLVGAGVAGAIAGFATTNHISNITFDAEFEDGRRVLATTDTKTFTKLLAAAYNNATPSEPASAPQPAMPVASVPRPTERVVQGGQNRG